MNTEVFSLVARFTIQARKVVGKIDTGLFISDANYRNNIFSIIDEQADEELMGLSLMVREKMGLLGQPQTNGFAKPNSPVQASPESESGSKYVFGARG